MIGSRADRTAIGNGSATFWAGVQRPGDPAWPSNGRAGQAVASHIEWPLGAHTPQSITSPAKFTSSVGAPTLVTLGETPQVTGRTALKPDAAARAPAFAAVRAHVACARPALIRCLAVSARGPAYGSVLESAVQTMRETPGIRRSRAPKPNDPATARPAAVM